MRDVLNHPFQKASQPRRQVPGGSINAPVQRLDVLQTAANANNKIDQLAQLQSTANQSAPLQRLTFDRFTGSARVTKMLASYSAGEKLLNELESEAVATYNRTHDQFYKIKDEQVQQDYTDDLSKLNRQLSETRKKSWLPSEYDDCKARLDSIIEKSRQLYRELHFEHVFGGKLTVVNKPNAKKRKSKAKKFSRKQNQVSSEDFAQTRKILRDIYVNDTSVIGIRLEIGETFNLAERSKIRGYNVPKAAVMMENRIRLARAELDKKQKQVDAAMRSNNKQKFSAAKKAQEAAYRAYEDSGLERKYKEHVQEFVRDATFRDLVKIAETRIGRKLLKEMTAKKYKDTANVVISVRDKYIPPVGGPVKTNKNMAAAVTYAPQPIRNRDTEERAPGGALTRMKGLKAQNPWQENARTDITLFHELVHTHHVQTGTLEKSDDFVPAIDAVHDADKPWTDAEGDHGVSKEEYATVGLGSYDQPKALTENNYRRGRRELGETDVSLRSQYTHIDEHGHRVVG